MKRTLAAACFAIVALGTAAQGQNYPETIPAGTNIEVRTNERINTRGSASGRVYSAVVERDVPDRDGRVAIPRGSEAELVARNIGGGQVAVDLQSVSVGGRRYLVETEADTYGGNKQGVGKNQRTAKYVGGGALLGTIIGAIAGGGKGAAIGAVAGGASGAGAQVLTRGRSVDVPAESRLTFRLDRSLTVGRRRNAR